MKLTCDWCSNCPACIDMKKTISKLYNAARTLFPKLDWTIYELYHEASEVMYIGFQVDTKNGWGKYEKMTLSEVKIRDPEELIKEVLHEIKKSLQEQA